MRVGPKSELVIPAGAEPVDLAGRHVMPGIINLHGHLGNTRGLTPLQVIQAASKNAAAFLGESKNLGTLEVEQVFIAGNRI